MENNTEYRRWIVEQIHSTDKRLGMLNETKGLDLNILFATVAITSLSVAAGSTILTTLLGVMCLASTVKYVISVFKFNAEIENYKAYRVNLEFEDMD
jgi:hypothetical protein